MTNDKGIGLRVAELRLMGGMTQLQLADTAGYTQAYISDIENGKKPVTTRRTLERLADALGVPQTQLTGMPLPPHTHEDLLSYKTVASIRAALDYPDEPVRPRRQHDLIRAVNNLMSARMNCNYALLGAGLAPVIAEARAARENSAANENWANRVLVRALVTASLTLKPIGWPDLAMRCAEQARDVAAAVGDADAYGAAEFAIAQCVLASGSRRRSYALAAAAARDLEGSADNQAHAWRGMLHLHAGLSAASLSQSDTADSHLDVAEHLAPGVHSNPWFMEFTVANVRTWKVGAAVENGTPERAPQLALAVDRSQLHTRQRLSRLDIDTGRGHYLAGNPHEAVRSFLRAHDTAPMELRTKPSVVELVGQMNRDAAPRPDDDLRKLAQLVGVAA